MNKQIELIEDICEMISEKLKTFGYSVIYDINRSPYSDCLLLRVYYNKRVLTSSINKQEHPKRIYEIVEESFRKIL